MIIPVINFQASTSLKEKRLFFTFLLCSNYNCPDYMLYVVCDYTSVPSQYPYYIGNNNSIVAF